MINGLFGSTAGTNYGENNSLMAITRNYSGPALLVAGVISMLLGFVGKLEALVGTVPQAVSGGIGGNIGYPGGFLPIVEVGDIFPNGLPAIATGAVAGIILNAIFLIFKPPQEAGEL